MEVFELGAPCDGLVRGGHEDVGSNTSKQNRAEQDQGRTFHWLALAMLSVLILVLILILIYVDESHRVRLGSTRSSAMRPAVGRSIET
jgi:hypothetical protein